MKPPTTKQVVPECVHISLDEVAAKLDTRTALVVTLVDGGLPIDFVAAMLGKSEGKITKILARARKRLAELHGEKNGRA